MFGRFFAFEMGCPEEANNQDAPQPLDQPQDQVMTLDEIQAMQDQGQPADGTTLICECKGLGCKKCQRKKAKVITLTGSTAPVPVVNMSPMRMPLAPWSMGMIMMNKRTF